MRDVEYHARLGGVLFGLGSRGMMGIRTRGYVVLVAVAAGQLGGCMAPASDPNDPGAVAAMVELGYTDPQSDAYRKVCHDEVMPFFAGSQGGSHLFATIRATGFPVDEEGVSSIVLTETVIHSDTGQELHRFTERVKFRLIDETTVEVESRFIFLASAPRPLDGGSADITLTLVADGDSTRRANLEQRILLQRDGG